LISYASIAAAQNAASEAGNPTLKPNVHPPSIAQAKVGRNARAARIVAPQR
jgi:hypothetical protein